MALGLPPGGGDITPMIKYDARAGRISRDNTDITSGFQAIFDLAQVEVGYIRFASMTAPDFVLVPAGSPLPDRPSKEHKRGIRLMTVLGRSCGGDLREFSSAAGCVIEAIDELHSVYEQAPEAREGKLPVVALKGATAVKTQTPTGTTTNYRPDFEITGWVDRPGVLPIIDWEERYGRRPLTGAGLNPGAGAGDAPAAPGRYDKGTGAAHVPPPGKQMEPAGTGTEF